MIRAIAALQPPLRLLVGGRALPLSFAFLCILVLAPPAFEPLPPLTDYVNHLARMHVMTHLADNPVLAQFYEIRWAIIPNLMMDLVVPPLARLIGVLKAGQLFLAATILILCTGPMAVHRALWGRLSPWPLLAFPLVYNGIFLYGLVNYLLGIGLAMWGTAAWIALRERPTALRLSVSAAFVLSLFFCHLFAVGLYGMALTAIEAQKLRERGFTRAAVWEALGFIVPFLPVLPLLASGPTMGLSTENVWESRGKLEGLYLTVELYRDSVDLLFAGILIGAGVWASRRGVLRMHGAGWALLYLGLAVYLVMPRQLFGSWIADQRLPVALAFQLIGFIHPDLRGRLSRGVLYSFLIGLTMARTAEIGVNWAESAKTTDDVTHAVSHIPRGSKILVAYADIPNETTALTQVLGHAPLISVISRDALTSTIFSVPGKQILNIRNAYSDLVDREDDEPPSVGRLLADSELDSPTEGRFWDGWPRRYDYVFVLYTEFGAPSPDPDFLELTAQGRGFQLYRVVAPE